ncbi:hypothetical protein Tco_1421832 [Tanacetum coccineum]
MYCLANGVKIDYANLIWEDIIHKLSKKTREKVVPYPRFISLLLEYTMPAYDNEELTINLTSAFFHFHSESALGCDASVDSTAEADPEISAPNDFIPSQQDQTKSAGDRLKTAHTNSGTNEESRADDISKKIKLYDLLNLLKDTRSAFFTIDSPQDESIIVSDESKEEEEVAKDKDTHASSHDVPEDTSIPHPPSLKSAQIQELMAQV